MNLLVTPFCFLLAATPLPGPAPAVASAPAGDPLSEALPILQAKYVDFAALQVTPGDRLGDLVSRSQGKIEVAPVPPGAAAPPILSVLLPGQIIYCRLASFETGTGFGAQLEKWIAGGAQGVVLDLRSSSVSSDFDGAARIAGFFTAPGTPLFRVEDAHQNSRNYTSPAGTDPLLTAEPVTMLVNRRTSGAAEALAACLKANGALVIGQSTQGRGALFADDRLPSGQTLHYLAGRVTLADGTPLWNHPLVPDIGLAVDAKREELDLDLIGQNRVLDVIQEAAGSHRLSEAALVRGEDPEIEAYLVPRGKKSVTGPVPQDVVLVNALDGLKAIRLSQRPLGFPAAGSPAPEIPSTVQ